MNRDADLTSGWEAYYRQTEGRPAWQEHPDEKVLEFIELAGMRDGHRLHVADFGSGDGRNLHPWLEAGAFVTAVDISPTALSKIAAASIGARLACPTLVSCNLEHLPLADCQFDMAQCLDALPQVKDAQRALQEMARTLRPGGKFLFNVFTPADCAFGEGDRLDDLSFSYKGTLFRFFTKEHVERIIPQSLRLLTLEHKRWLDPAHPPFRPKPHTHDGIYVVCERAPN